MKVNVTPKSFNPTAKTVDLSNIDNFDIHRLLAILNATSRATIYDPVSPGHGVATVVSGVLTLQYDTSQHAANDTLMAIYDYPDRGAGVDYAVNSPTIPNVGASFNSSGPYANFLLLRTIPKNLSRTRIGVHNTSTGRIAVVRDDGTASAGTAPVNATIIPLEAASVSGASGGSWISDTFKGRVQIYAVASNVFISAYED